MATDPKVIRRFARLLQYLGKEPAEFARETGLDRSYVSRLQQGHRAAHGGVFQHKVTVAYGLDPKYWTSVIDLEPQDCLVAKTSPRDIVLEAAIIRGDSPDRLMQLIHGKPPPGKELSLTWWLAFYVDLVEGRS